MGMLTARDGFRWHLIEREPGIYDWSSFLPMLQAAHRQGVQVIWDLCHYGWPDFLDLFSPQFSDRFARFAEAAARVVHAESNEILRAGERNFLLRLGSRTDPHVPARKGTGRGD